MKTITMYRFILITLITIKSEMLKKIKEEMEETYKSTSTINSFSSSASSNSQIKRIRRRSGLILDHLYQSKEWADCDINLGDEVFTVHRAIICTAIPYLKSIFLEQQQSTEQLNLPKLIVTINYPPLEVKAFEWLIQWSYALSVTINMDNVKSLLIATDYLQVNNVFQYCIDYLDGMISIDNALTIKDWIANYNVDNEFRDKINCFIYKQFNLIVETPGFVKCNIDQLIEMISDSKLNIVHEIDVFNAIIKWITADPINRIKLTPKLLIYLRWCSLSYEQIINQIGKEEIIVNNDECRKLIIEVLSCLTFDSIVSDHQSYKSIWKHPRDNQLTIRQANQQRLVDNQVDINDQQQIVVCLLSSSQLDLMIFDYQNNQLTPWLTIDQLTTRETHRVTRIGDNLLLIARDCFLINLITGKVNNFVPTELKIFDWPDCISDVNSNQVFISGGSNCLPYNVVYSLKINDNCVPSFVINQLPFLNTPRAGHRLAYCLGSLYAIGGLDESKRPLDTVERYDEILAKWIPMKPMITPRSGHGIIVHQNAIYVAGGYNGSTFISNFEVYHPSKDTWSLLSPLIVKGKIISLIANQQSLLILIRSPAKLVQLYSYASNSWSIVEVNCLSDERLIAVTSIPAHMIMISKQTLESTQSESTIESTI